MPKGNPGYFGVQLGQAIAGGAAHISDAIRRKYEMQRQDEMLKRQQGQQDLGNQIALAGKGIKYDPSQPLDPAIFDPIISEAQQRANMEKEQGQARTELMKAQAQSFRNKPVTPSPGQKAIDTAYGKDYATYVAGGGFADVATQIGTLEEIKNRLETGKEKLTGLGTQLTPDWLRPTVNPKSIEAQQQVEQTIQRTLRQTLGAQFTENEGKLFMQRGYNPNLSEAQNAKKLGILIGQLKTMANAKAAAMDYFEANGTLQGFKGNIYTIQGGDIKPVKPTGGNMSMEQLGQRSGSIKNSLTPEKIAEMEAAIARGE